MTIHLPLWKRFLIYGFIGLVIEVLYTGFASLFDGDLSMTGKTFLVMIPIYGMALFLEPIHAYLKPYPWWLRGFTYLILIWSIEYISGFILQNLLGACPWHYTDPLNINGFITLKMAPEWFCAGLGFEILHDYITKIADLNSNRNAANKEATGINGSSYDMHDQAVQEQGTLQNTNKLCNE